MIRIYYIKILWKQENSTNYLYNKSMDLQHILQNIGLNYELRVKKLEENLI